MKNGQFKKWDPRQIIHKKKLIEATVCRLQTLNLRNTNGIPPLIAFVPSRIAFSLFYNRKINNIIRVFNKRISCGNSYFKTL